MAFHSQSVNLLSKLASALGHGGGGENVPLVPVPTDREMEARGSVWECSSDVTVYTASSSNPAGTFATETRFRYITGIGQLVVELITTMLAVQVAFSQTKKRKRKQTNMCETRATDRIVTIDLS